MKVLKIVAEGVATSFRYPHFMQGVHPTFRMPPPATIYGHICSALGEWFDPKGVLFGVQFFHKGVFEDIEHVHVVGPATGRGPGWCKKTWGGANQVLAGSVSSFGCRV